MPWSLVKTNSVESSRPLALEHVEHLAEPVVGLGDRPSRRPSPCGPYSCPAPSVSVNSCATNTGGGCDGIVEQHHHLRQAARVEQRLAVHALVAVGARSAD